MTRCNYEHRQHETTQSMFSDYIYSSFTKFTKREGQIVGIPYTQGGAEYIFTYMFIIKPYLLVVVSYFRSLSVIVGHYVKFYFKVSI